MTIKFTSSINRNNNNMFRTRPRNSAGDHYDGRCSGSSGKNKTLGSCHG